MVLPRRLDLRPTESILPDDALPERFVRAEKSISFDAQETRKLDFAQIAIAVAGWIFVVNDPDSDLLEKLNSFGRVRNVREQFVTSVQTAFGH